MSASQSDRPRLSGLHLVAPTPPLLWSLASTALEPSASSSAVTPVVCWPLPSPALCPVVRCLFLYAFQRGRGVGSTPACPVCVKSERPFKGGRLCTPTRSHSLGTQKGDTCSFADGKCPPAFLKAPAIGIASECQAASLSHASSPGLFLRDLKGVAVVPALWKACLAHGGKRG